MFVIGIAGGTCSGKSTLATKLKEHYGNRCICIHMDNYYIHPSPITIAPITGKEYVEHNHPDAMRLDEMRTAFEEALADEKVQICVIEGLFALHLPGSELRRMGVGVMYTFLGLVIFLTGVNVGFLPMGQYLGHHLAAEKAWLLVPLGALIGYLVVRAEPAVHVLNSQVEEVSSGAISKSAMMMALSIGVAASVSIAMLRVLTGISIWWFIAPGYLIALALTFFCPPVFTAIAFDSGGVASGPLTAAFMLPLALGACGAVGGNVLEDAFGVVAMVAMTPLIAIQILGVVYRVKTRRIKAEDMPEEEEIIDV